MNKLLFLALILPLLAARCGNVTWGYDTSRGMKPIYLPTENYDLISFQPMRPLTESAKIYVKDKLIFAIEQGEGVHIIDNSNPTQPQKIRFLRLHLD